MKKTPTDISTTADAILSDISARLRIKTAELEAVKAATPVYTTELSQLLHKTAAELRASTTDVTYKDLEEFLKENA